MFDRQMIVDPGTDPRVLAVTQCRRELTAVSGMPTWSMDDTQLSSHTQDLLQLRSMIDEAIFESINEADERSIAHSQGVPSTSAWIGGISRGEASKLVCGARVVNTDIEDTRSALAFGRITTEQAVIIGKAIQALPDKCGTAEIGAAQTTLLEYVNRLNVDQFKRLANHIIEVIDPDGADKLIGDQLKKEERNAWNATKLTMRRFGDGTTKGSFTLPALQGDMLRTVLEALASPRRTANKNPNLDSNLDADGAHSDAAARIRSYPQRLGHALCELIEHLPTNAYPQSGGLEASITVNVDLEKMRTGLGVALLSTNQELSITQTRRLACNARILPMVLNGDSQILDLGRSKRTHNSHQRRAIAKRDGGCCWKNCDRPPAWCEVHHPQEWKADHGPTDLYNGALFCYFHHHLLHNGQWHAQLAHDNIIEVIPPKRIDPQQRPLRHDRHKLQHRLQPQQI